MWPPVVVPSLHTACIYVYICHWVTLETEQYRPHQYCTRTSAYVTDQPFVTNLIILYNNEVCYYTAELATGRVFKKHILIAPRIINMPTTRTLL
jgi:hypothetical protein